MVDPLNIFQEIKTVVLKLYGNVDVYAVGSRAKGSSKKGGWDFDIAIVYEDADKIMPQEAMKMIRPFFKDMYDENNNEVKVDVWTVPKSQRERFINGIKLSSNAIML